MLTYNSVGIDATTGFQEDIHPWTVQAPWALKAKASKDPDLPSVREAVMGPHAKEFWKAMESEIKTLEGMDTWDVVPLYLGLPCPKELRQFQAHGPFGLRDFQMVDSISSKPGSVLWATGWKGECITLKTPIPHLWAGQLSEPLCF